MKITEDAQLTGSPEDVFALRATEDFQEERLARSGALRHSHQVTTVGERTVITTTRAMPTAQFPDAARRLVGNELVIHETQDWGPPAADGSRQARVSLQVDGAPVTLKGTLDVLPNGAGSRQQLRAELKASIPFVGGKIESAAAPAIAYGFHLESEIVNERLGRG